MIKAYPDFMEKRDCEISYQSKSILGILYREIKSKSEDLLKEHSLEP
jgi:hypothetical protein